MMSGQLDLIYSRNESLVERGTHLLFLENLRKDCEMSTKERVIRNALWKCQEENRILKDKHKSEVSMYRVLLGISIVIGLVMAFIGGGS